MRYPAQCTPVTFQRVMEGLLKFIPGLLVYLDDLFVSGLFEGKDLSSLKQLLTRLQEAGEKYLFLDSVATYLEYRIDCKRLHPIQSRSLRQFIWPQRWQCYYWITSLLIITEDFYLTCHQYWYYFMCYYRQIPHWDGPTQSKKHSNNLKNFCYRQQMWYILMVNFWLY